MRRALNADPPWRRHTITIESHGGLARHVVCSCGWHRWETSDELALRVANAHTGPLTTGDNA